MQNYNICFSLDSKYTEQFTVSAVSILKNADIDENINFYILDGGLTEKDKSNIELLKNIKAFNIEYIEIDEKDFKDCPMLKEKSDEHKDYHVTLPTYFRFKLPELLPNLDKVLYLDCDVIVRTSLKELFSLSFKDKAVAMVEDVETKRESDRLNIKKYFNAGVMLINLDYWRKNSVSVKLFEYAKKNKKTILWQDQDVINVVLEGKIKALNLKWNYQYFLYDKIEEKNLADCCILHLAGRFKPWLMPFEHFIYDYYYYFLALTPYKNRIIDYKQKSSGRRLKNNIGGTQTNILLDVSSDDIQKLYQEISKTYDYTNSLGVKSDEKISKVYEEITKNYEYTNELRNASKYEIEEAQKEVLTKVDEARAEVNQQIETSADAIASQTDEKISKVYEEITKNYEYTNELRNASKYEIEEAQKEVLIKVDEARAEVNQQIETSADAIASQTDEKISKVYEEITKNYEYTNELRNASKYEIEEAQKEVLTKVDEARTEVNQQIESSADAIASQTDEKISKVYEEITKNYEYTNELRNASKYEIEEAQKEVLIKVDEARAEVNQQIETSADAIASQTDEKISKVYEEITKNYEYTNGLRDNFYKEIKEQDIFFNEKIANVEQNLTENIDKTKTSLIDRLEEVNTSTVLGLKDLKTILDLNIDFTKKELTTLYEKIAFNDEIFKKDLNELRDDFIKLLNDKIEFLISQTDEKISKVYEEISKNYEYTNELRNASKYEIEEAQKKVLSKVDEARAEVNQQIESSVDVITSQTDEKISKVYEEISKNYDYTNKLSQENKDLTYSLKSDVENQIFKAKDDMLTYIDHSNNIISNKIDNLITDVDVKITNLEENQDRKNNLKISEVYTYTNSELTKVFATLNKNNSNYENKLEYSLKESYRLIEEGKKDISSLRVELEKKKEIEAEFNKKLENVDLEHKKQVEVLTAEFEEKFNNQRIKYENKLMTMETQISDLEAKYEESQKGFFTKIIERCKKR